MPTFLAFFLLVLTAAEVLLVTASIVIDGRLFGEVIEEEDERRADDLMRQSKVRVRSRNLEVEFCCCCWMLRIDDCCPPVVFVVGGGEFDDDGDDEGDDDVGESIAVVVDFL